MSRRAALALGWAPLLVACSPAEPPSDGGAPVFTAPAPAATAAAPADPGRGVGGQAPPTSPVGPTGVGRATRDAGSFAGGSCSALAVHPTAVAWSAPCSPSSEGCATSEIQDPHDVYLAPASGGPLVKIVGPTGILGGMALDDEHLYWTAAGPGRVREARLDDHRRGGLAASRPSARPSAIAVDDTHVFWLDEGQPRLGYREVGSGAIPVVTARGAVIEVPKRGGAPVEIARDLQKPALLALDDASVYWTERGARMREIRRAPKGGGPATTLADAYEAGALAVDEGFVYWADGAAVRRVQKAGGTPAEVFHDVRPGSVHRIVLDRDFVFAASTDANGGEDAVLRAPKAGGPAVPLARLTGVEALAVGGDALWVCSFEGVYRLPDPDHRTPCDGP